MYRKGSSRGGDWTFTTKYGNIEKKVNAICNIKKELNNNTDFEKYPEDKTIFESFNECFDENLEEIIKKLSAFDKTIDKKEKASFGLSVMFDQEAERKYLIDFKIFQNILLSSGSEGRSEKHSIVSKGENSTCSVCFLTDVPVNIHEKFFIFIGLR